MSVSKKDAIAQLKEASRLLELLGDDKARAFSGAVRNLESFEGDFEALFLAGRLHEIRGIGRGLSAELGALKERERIPLLDELYSRVPKSVRELFVVSGLGPKKIAALWKEGIDSLEALVEGCGDGRVAACKGFSQKGAETLLEAANFALASRERMLLSVAEVYDELIRQGVLEVLPELKLWTAGGLRRRLETVDRLDFVVAGTDAEALERALPPGLDEVETVDGKLKTRLERYPVTFYLARPESAGAVLAYRTGNGDYLEGLKERAGALGYALAESGLYRGDEPVPAADEAELFRLLKLPNIEPERREEASPPEIDGLIAEEDIHGLVHNHSSWSDGAHSLREMVAAARALGYRYLAMADHSRSSYVANGLSIERVRAQREEIEAIRRELKGSDFTLLHGIEVDILADGSLDYPDEVLAGLDYCVVSVHSHFGLSEREQTARIVRAVHSPYAHVLGHPTGRLLLRRPGYPLDLRAVIEACAETGTVIEINANPYRLDLDWRWVKKAKEMGCLFSINPDAHGVEGYRFVRYGVMMVRKAGLTPDDVINGAPTAQAFLSRLKRP
jgi:DNA polymerase (family X)